MVIIKIYQSIASLPPPSHEIDRLTWWGAEDVAISAIINLASKTLSNRLLLSITNESHRVGEREWHLTTDRPVI